MLEPVKTSANWIEQFARHLQALSLAASVSYIRSTTAPELADAAVERLLSWEREFPLDSFGPQSFAMSSRK